MRLCRPQELPRSRLRLTTTPTPRHPASGWSLAVSALPAFRGENRQSGEIPVLAVPPQAVDELVERDAIGQLCALHFPEVLQSRRPRQSFCSKLCQRHRANSVPVGFRHSVFPGDLKLVRFLHDAVPIISPGSDLAHPLQNGGFVRIVGPDQLETLNRKAVQGFQFLLRLGIVQLHETQAVGVIVHRRGERGPALTPLSHCLPRPPPDGFHLNLKRLGFE